MVKPSVASPELSRGAPLSGGPALIAGRPDKAALRLIRRLLPRGGHFLEIGSAGGWYSLRLMDRADLAGGYDPSDAALARLRAATHRLGLADRIRVLGPDLRHLETHRGAEGPADVVFCTFGSVLDQGGASDRTELFRRFGGLLRPGTGRMILEASRGAIRDLEHLRRELSAAGLALETIEAEGLLPEAITMRSILLRRVDAALAALSPWALGQGLLVVTRLAPDPLDA